MDKRIRNLIIFFSIVFVVLVGNLTYLQFFKAKQLLSSSYNVRSLAEELATKRGAIITADGIEIAQSERASSKKYKRFYSGAEIFSNITGFYDSRYGRFALEQKYNDELLGKDSADSLAEYFDRIAGKGEPGNDLILTIDSKIQRVAYKNLIGRRGAVVAIRPDTGAVIALASYPGYNPNTLRSDWKNLIEDKGSPLVNRATTGLYPPGSSFKTVTLSALLASNKYKGDKKYKAPSTIQIYGGKVTNYKSKNYFPMKLDEAFKLSINTVFAQVGLEVGAKELVGAAQNFGFNKNLDFDLAVKQSTIKSASDMDDLEVAWTAVGQAHTLATPLQMAMVASAIANDGILMKPYMVNTIRDYQGRTIKKSEPTELEVIMPKDKAKVAKDFMTQVVKSGTGTGANIEGVEVAGKTGTAEIKGRPPHAWFICFAPAKKPKIAIAVLVENGGTGGSRAAPIARQIIEETLKK